jgi:hypothetical protein
MRTRLAVLGLALVLALTACAAPADDGLATANGAGPGGADPSPTTSLSPQEAALKFAQCMRDNGIPMEDPTFEGGGVGISIGGEGVDRAKVDAAMKACEQYSPFGGNREGPEDPAMAENARKFAQCMRDNGVPDFPDPDGGRIAIDGSIAEDPDFPAAQEKCQQEFMPGAVNGNGPGTVTGGGPAA